MPERAAAPGGDPLHDLIGRSAAGDQEGLRLLYDATSRRVFGLALKIVKRQDLAEDATIDAYMQIWREAMFYDPGRGNPLGWILTIARSRAVDRLRSLSPHSREQDLAEARGVQDPAPDPEASCQGSERDELVRRALEALPQEQRAAIEAAYFSGLTYAEVARAGDIPLGTVKTRIRAGMSTLRRKLAVARGGLA